MSQQGMKFVEYFFLISIVIVSIEAFLSDTSTKKEDDMEIEIMVVYCILAALGIALNFYGYAWLKVSAFSSASVLGGYVANDILNDLNRNQNTSDWPTAVSWILISSVSILTGCMSLYFKRLGIASIGACAGFCLFQVLCMTVLLHINSEYNIRSTEILIVSSTVGALLGGSLTSCFTHHFLILSTSLSGGILVLRGVGVLTEWFPTPGDVMLSLTNSLRYDISTVHALVVLSLLVSLVGMIIQFQTTAKSVDHRLSLEMVKRTRMV